MEKTKSNRQQVRPFDELGAALRRTGEAMVGDACTAIPLRLRKGARNLEGIAQGIPEMSAVAGELEAAATAYEHGRPVPALSTFMRVLQVPVSKEFYSRIPEEQRADWRILHEQLGQADNSLKRFQGAAWLASIGPSRAEQLALLVRGDERLAADLGLLSSHACALAEGAIYEVGIALLTVSRQLVKFLALLAFLGICEDDCVQGKTRNCTATDVTFAPYGDADTDAADFDNAITFLKVLSWTPKVPISPGGGGMIREIVKQLGKIKEASDKLKKDLDGYSVFVRLSYEKCVNGLCGTYWKEQSKVVEVAPPAGKKHQLGKGWKQSVIDDLGKNDKSTADQLKEFMQLAEKKCP